MMCWNFLKYNLSYQPLQFFKLSDQKDSEKMICWESQLLDSTRILLTEKYNDYRGDVARGTCPRCNANEKYQYMCEMVGKSLKCPSSANFVLYFT